MDTGRPAVNKLVYITDATPRMNILDPFPKCAF